VTVMTGAIVLLALIRLTVHFAGRGWHDDHAPSAIPHQLGVAATTQRYSRGTGRSAHLWVPVAARTDAPTSAQPALSGLAQAPTAVLPGTTATTTSLPTQRPAV
jgi:hypothetical protein